MPPSSSEDTPAQRDAKAVGLEADRVVEARVVKAMLDAQLRRLRWEARLLGGITVFLSACSLFAVLATRG